MKTAELQNSFRTVFFSRVILFALLALFYLYRDKEFDETDSILVLIFVLYTLFDLYKSYHLRGVNLVEYDGQIINVFNLLTKHYTPVQISEISYVSLAKNRCLIYKTGETIEIDLVNASRKGKEIFANEIYPEIENVLDYQRQSNPKDYPFGVTEIDDNLVISHGEVNQFMTAEHLVEFIQHNKAWRQKNIMVKVGDDTKALGSILNAE